MALSKTVTLKNNFGELSTFSDAYVRVEHVGSTKELSKAIVIIYKEKGGIPVSSNTYEYAHDLNGNNNIKQAYEHLKTLPEFADAVDC